MSRQVLRSAGGGRIDRSRPLAFTFDVRRFEGYAGDTLASALLANGVKLVGRSFKYHRPRGLMSAGVDEPNALVEIGAGGRRTTNPRATEIELTAGLEARSVNRWPSLAFDVSSVNNLFARFLAAGFYSKTFMWPSWRLFEGPIRRAAGIGRPAAEPGPDRYEKRHAHCKVLIVGSGPAGLTAASAAAGSGARVMLVEKDPAFGGSLLWRPGEIDGLAGPLWAEKTLAALSRFTDTRLLGRATAIGYYDHNLLAVVERPASGPTRERLWRVRAKRVILAAGALERPLVFPGNDRPGVMLASAAHQFAARWGVRAGRRLVVFTNNDTAYQAAGAARAAGVEVVAVVESRASAPRDAAQWLGGADIPVFPASQVVETRGGHGLKAARVRLADGAARWLACEALAMSGGWHPTVHLFSQSGGKL
ncbi:MAG: 2Fe-2S iron-sulfur cluster-binding protein, partial [Caulobacteraceae bacterium]